MFKAVWAAVVIMNGVPDGVVQIEEPPVKSRGVCEASIAAHRHRAPEWIRGALRLGWDAEIAGITAMCEPVGAPA